MVFISIQFKMNAIDYDVNMTQNDERNLGVLLCVLRMLMHRAKPWFKNFIPLFDLTFRKRLINNSELEKNFAKNKIK